MNPEGRVHIEKEKVCNNDFDSGYRASHVMLVWEAYSTESDSL